MLSALKVRLSRLRRSIKRLILIVNDLLSIFLSTLFNLWVLRIPDLILTKEHGIIFLTISIVYLIVGMQQKLFSVLTRYTDYRVLFKIVVSLLCSHVILFFVEQLLSINVLIYRFPLLSFVFTSVFVSAPRIIWRLINDERLLSKHDSKKLVKTLIYGGGEAGRIFIDVIRDGQTDIDIVGVIDDDPYKQGTLIYGIPVLGDRHELARIVKDYEIAQIALAIPSLTGPDRELILDLTKGLEVKLMEIPLIEDTILGNISSKNLKEIDIADLLGRKEVVLNQSSLNQYFNGRTVLVTGAGGSIGSEICRQVAKFLPKRLLLLGHGENSIYLIIFLANSSICTGSPISRTNISPPLAKCPACITKRLASGMVMK